MAELEAYDPSIIYATTYCSCFAAISIYIMQRLLEAYGLPMEGTPLPLIVDQGQGTNWVPGFFVDEINNLKVVAVLAGDGVNPEVAEVEVNRSSRGRSDHCIHHEYSFLNCCHLAIE